jgi:hypothetical protein
VAVTSAHGSGTRVAAVRPAPALATELAGKASLMPSLRLPYVAVAGAGHSSTEETMTGEEPFEPPDPVDPARLDTNALDLSPDAIPVGRFYLRGEKIGEGATGRVFRGWRRQDGSPIAVKLLKPGAGDDDVMRQVRAFQVLKQIRHPNLVAVHDVLLDGDLCALIMDLVEGQDLRSLLDRRNNRLDPSRAGQILSQITAGLAALHTAGVIHRDIKPENVLLEWRNCQPFARLTDFGLAKAMVTGVAVTRANHIPGTLPYLAPELLKHQPAGPASDVYAVGVVAHELFLGERPAIAFMPVERPDGIGDLIWQVIGGCLAWDAAGRPPAVELVDWFAALAEGPLPADAPMPQPSPPSADYLTPNPVSDDQPATTGPAPAPYTPATPRTPAPAPALVPVPATLWPAMPSVETTDRPAPQRRKDQLVEVTASPATTPEAPTGPSRHPIRKWMTMIATGLVVAGAAVAGIVAGHRPSSHHRSSSDAPVMVYLPVTATSPAPGRVTLSYPDASRLAGFGSYLIFRDGKQLEHGPTLRSPYTDPFVDRDAQHCYQVAAWIQPPTASPAPRNTATRTCLTASGPSAGTASPTPVPR